MLSFDSSYSAPDSFAAPKWQRLLTRARSSDQAEQAKRAFLNLDPHGGSVGLRGNFESDLVMSVFQSRFAQLHDLRASIFCQREEFRESDT